MSDLDDISELRGISLDVLTRAGIYIEADSDRTGWIGLPYPHLTGTWKTRYRNPDPEGRPKYLDGPGAAPHLYNPLVLGPGEEEVWFCEGEFDTLALIDQGYPAVGVPGVHLVDDDTQRTSRTGKWKLLFEATRCVVIFDNDQPGREAGRRLARLLDGVMFEWGDSEYNDVNSFHRDDPGGLAVALDEFRVRLGWASRLESLSEEEE